MKTQDEIDCEKYMEAKHRLEDAAPEMLLALESAFNFLVNPPYDPNGNHKSGMIINISDAIKKAKGE